MVIRYSLIAAEGRRVFEVRIWRVPVLFVIGSSC